MRLTWSTPDPSGVGAWLAQAGLPTGSGGRVDLGTAVLEVWRAPASSHDRLRLSTAARVRAHPAGGPALAAVGWATVDPARLHPGPLERLPDETALGARAWMAPRPRAATDDVAPATVYLEPATEGLLAAALARHGEGLACLWVRGARPAVGAALRPASDGALGPARLVRPRSRFGPFVLLLGA